MNTFTSNISDGKQKPNEIINASQCPIYKQEKMIPPEKPGYYLVALVVTSKPFGYDFTDKVYYVNDYHKISMVHDLISLGQRLPLISIAMESQFVTHN